MPFQFCTGSGHVHGDVHGDVHDGAEAGEEDAGKEDLSDVDEGILGDEHHVFDIRYVIARQVDGMAEEDGRQAGCQDDAQGRPKGSQALFRPAIDEVHRRSQDDDRRDDGRCDGTHTAQDHGEKEEVDFRMLAQGFVQGLVPVIGIIAGCDFASLFGTAFSRCLASRCTDLRVADIHEGEVVRIPRLDRLSGLPGPVDFDLIPVGLFGFQAFGRDFVGIIVDSSCKSYL